MTSDTWQNWSPNIESIIESRVRSPGLYCRPMATEWFCWWSSPVL